MNKTRTTRAQSVCRFLIYTAAFCLLISACIPLAAAGTQADSPGYTSDNSDWWSYTRIPDADEESISQHREPPASTFQILGFKVDDAFGKVTAKLGKATVIERGDASTGRSQICYSSPGEHKTYLIFRKR